MALNSNLTEIVEYRGVEGLVAAEVLTDDNTTGYTTGTPFAIAGVAEISRATESSTEAHYYDNIPAVVIATTGADTLTISASALPLDVLAKITGQYYDDATGAMTEGPRDQAYFAVGYKTKKTSGAEVYVWRFKGMFSIPDQTNATENDSTDANGQELTFTGVATTHKFEKTGKGAKAIVVDTGLDLADVSTFFAAVTTPDTLTAKPDYTLSITQAAGTTVTVKRNGVTITASDKIHAGDALTISVTGGTVTVDGTAFISGNVHIVTGNTAIVSTAA